MKGMSLPNPNQPQSLYEMSAHVSLRDWFAGMAMQGLLAGYDFEMREKSTDKSERTGFDDDSGTGTQWGELLASEAYQIADDMIAARCQ